MKIISMKLIKTAVKWVTVEFEIDPETSEVVSTIPFGQGVDNERKCDINDALNPGAGKLEKLPGSDQDGKGSTPPKQKEPVKRKDTLRL